MPIAAAPESEQVAEYAIHRPAPPLRPFVESGVGYELRGFAPGIHQGLPSRHLTLVVSFAEPLDMVAMPDPHQQPVALGALVGGLHAAPVSIRHDGTQFGMQMQMTTRAARTLLGMPAAELAAMVVPLDAVFPRAGELVDRLASAESWAARFGIIDAAVRAGLDAATMSRAPRPEVAYAFDRLAAAAGAVDVASLAAEIGWSRRHLAQEFRLEYGLAPKAMARVLRFERARWMVARPDRPALATVAATCGYADQAHMTREWTELAGVSPAAWLAAEEFPFVQDDDALAAAG
jgi:AraC-like DNA-binding protein